MSKVEYKVVEPFNLLDLHCILNEKHFKELLTNMIDDGEWYLNVEFNKFTKFTVPSMLWEYRDILESHRFIKKKNIVLKPGMKVVIKGKGHLDYYRVCQLHSHKLTLISTTDWTSWDAEGFWAGTTVDEYREDFIENDETLVLEE